MLRPGPVKASFALGVFALNGLAGGVDRLKHLVGPGLLPAFGRTHDPLHFLVATNLDNGRLVARTDNDRVVRRVIVNRVDVYPGATGAGTHDVAEMITFIKLGELFRGQRLAGLCGINIQAHSALIEYLEHIVAIRIKDVPEAPFINHLAVVVNFNDDVSNRSHVLTVGKFLI